MGIWYPQAAYYQYNGWWGTLAQDQEDATGREFRRNRYYDPLTDRFTQEDPIGLAGGLNAYGFAESDPINMSDPFGLCDGWDITINECGVEINRRQNHLDHDRFYMAVNGIVVDLTQTLDPITVTPPDDRDFWQKTGDFAAGFGDFWTFNGTKAIREAFVCNSCVNYNSDQYFFGQVTAAVSGFVIAEGVEAGEAVTHFKPRYHSTPHPFGWLGGSRLAHLQLNWWIPGVKGSGGAFRIPLPW